MPRVEKRKPEHLNVRLPVAEMEALRGYCEETQRTPSDVIREFIRSLSAAVSPALTLPPNS